MTRQLATPRARPLVNLYHKVVNFHKTTRNLLHFFMERLLEGLLPLSLSAAIFFLVPLKKQQASSSQDTAEKWRVVFHESVRVCAVCVLSIL